MSSILDALDQGYSAEEILAYLSKAIPKIVPTIRKATSQGYTLQQVLGYISSAIEPKMRNDKFRSQAEIEEENRKEAGSRIKKGLVMGAGLLAAPAASAGLSSALSRALPNSLKNATTPISSMIGLGAPSPQQQNVAAQSSNGLNVSHPSPGNVPASAPMQQTGQSQNQLLNPLSTQLPPVQGDNIPQIEQKPQIELFGNAKKYLESLGILDTVKERLSRGNTPEAVAASLNIKRSGEAKVDPELLKNIEAYAKNAQNEPQGRKELESTSKELVQMQPEAERPKIEKSQTVSTPQGIGEVKEIRNGKALVEIDGKTHKIDEEDLEQEPEAIKNLDLDSAVEDYLSRIPESHKSSVIDVSLYDPENQELQVRFPSGEQWIYGPIPEEVFEKINSMTGIPVSSGESNLRGTIWEKGVEGSAGADFYKLIKKLVKEGSIKERKLKTGIDLFKGFTRVKKRK